MYLLGLKRSEMPKYLPIKFQEVKRTHVLKTKSWLNVAIKVHWVFKHMMYFNDLPKAIRVIKDRKVFIKGTKRYYRNKSLARSLSL